MTASFAHTLGAQQVKRARHRLVEPGLEVRDRFGARHRIVHERARQKLASLVVDRLLHQGLPESLRDPAVHLAFGHQRVHHAADIVDRGEPRDFDHAGVGIHFGFHHLAAVGPGLALHALGMRYADLAFGLAPRELGEADGPVGPGDAIVPAGEFDVGRRGFEFLCRQLPARLHQHSRAGKRGATADLQRPRTAGATAGLCNVRIPLEDAHRIG